MPVDMATMRRELYAMRTLEAARRTIGVVFVAAIAALAVALTETHHAIALGVGFAVLGLAHLGFTLRLRALFVRDQCVLAKTSAVGERKAWDSSWLILVGDAIVTIALIVVAALSLS